MHTIHELTADLFEYRRDGESVPRGEVMPDVSVDDRLGVVMADPTDGLGAGNFILSCVTAFYDVLRREREEFFEYPDYYTFQATPDPADYLEFDVWPDHKNVAVPAEPERVLRAVNDRAITVLLVPDGSADGSAGGADIDDATRRSGERTVEACYRYAADGDLADAEFSIRLPRDPAEAWYRGTVDTTDAGAGRFEPALADETHITQRFRRIEFDEAIAALPAGT